MLDLYFWIWIVFYVLLDGRNASALLPSRMWRALSHHHPFYRWSRSQSQETVCQSRHLYRKSHLVLVLNVDGQEIRRLEFKDKRLLPVNNNERESKYDSPLGSTFLPPRWELKNAFWLDKQTDKLFATILAPEVEVNARAIFPTVNIEAMIIWKTNLSTGSLEVFPAPQSSSAGQPEWKIAIGSEDGKLWGYGLWQINMWVRKKVGRPSVFGQRPTSNESRPSSENNTVFIN